MPAPPLSSNWIGRLIGGGSDSVADRLERGRRVRAGWLDSGGLSEAPGETVTTGIGPVPASSTPRTAPRLAVSRDRGFGRQRIRAHAWLTSCESGVAVRTRTPK